MRRQAEATLAGGRSDDEQLPFLHGAQGIAAGAAAGPRLPSPPAPILRRRARLGLLTLLLLLVAATVCALAAVVLGVPPSAAPAQPPAQPPAPDDAHAGPGPGSGAPGPTPDDDDDFPPVPRLRDAADYILDPAWDAAAPPTTRELRWTVVDAMLNPDGVFRPMMLINNQFPGPLVECNDGDTLVVRVANRAANATALHFHGLFQNGSNPMDGAVGVTQCPIAPNSSFTYRFQVARQAGTYWYHAHHSAQASDGLLGPVVVHPRRSDPGGPYASDRVVMVQDHYHNTTAQLLMDYLQPDRENDEPVPDNALINGCGRRACADFPGWPCDASNASAPVLDLARGRRHRLRFINVGAFAQFQIEVDEHPFYVTEVDGTDVHPEPFHRLNMLPAQRYSVVLETNVSTASAFWLCTRMVAHCFSGNNARLEPELKAVVRYVEPGAAPPRAAPESTAWGDAIKVICRDLDTSALRPVAAATPPPADDFVALRANFRIGAWRLSRGFFNGSTWRANATHPALHRFLDAPPAAQALAAPLAVNDRAFAPDRELVLQTAGIRTVDISINNFDDDAHPFHLHGHKFFVLAQAKSGYPPPAHEFAAYLDAHGGLPQNPLRRDTVTVEPFAWVVIRVVLDNPGLWALHCHNAWHSEAGMLMQLLVRADVVSGWELDPAQRAMCALDGVATGMRPDDSIWFGSF